MSANTADALLRAVREGGPAANTDTAAADALRAPYFRDADGLGSVPPPDTLSGMASTGATLMRGARMQALMDKLGERLAFERAGTRLYEAFLRKCRLRPDQLGPVDIGRVEHFMAEEARHFAMLSGRLAELGHAYGDFDAHDGLWAMAEKTAEHDTARMALVPRVLEARGLDVTPGMIERLRHLGDTATATILEVILREEVAHVAAGTRWYQYCCERDGVEPVDTFFALLREYMGVSLRGPFNRPARLEAGFVEAELDRLAALALPVP